MLHKKIDQIVRRLANYRFSTEKYEEAKSVNRGLFVKNENLRFSDENSELYLSPMYPQLTHKGKNVFSINSDRIVMYFKFTPKHKMGVIIEIC
jgi:hypothetical protein